MVELTQDEFVEADDAMEAFSRCSYSYGDEYAGGYVISSVRVEQDEHKPTRWRVWYEAHKNYGGPMTSLRLSDVDDVLRSECD